MTRRTPMKDNYDFSDLDAILAEFSGRDDAETADCALLRNLLQALHRRSYSLDWLQMKTATSSMLKVKTIQG